MKCENYVSVLSLNLTPLRLNDDRYQAFQQALLGIEGNVTTCLLFGVVSYVALQVERYRVPTPRKDRACIVLGCQL